MTVNQASDRMIAQWNTFNIGQNAAVQFHQPHASSVALNRIQDQNPSQILGSLTSNGQVFLMNPSGIYFGQNATVNVGGLVASSLAMSDHDFLAGKYAFSGTDSSGSVINAGAITAGSNGIIALISPAVVNEGTLTAEGGSIALAAGRRVNLDFKGDGLINLMVDEAAVNAQVSNEGLIKSDGGMVVMTARAAGQLIGSVVNNSGIIEATTLSTVNGRIILDGGDAGIVENTGTLSAIGDHAGETGGAIVLTGEKVGVSGDALIDVSGQTNGGDIFVGGGFRGADTSISNAKRTYIGEAATLRADGGQTGNGGKIAVWSDEVTRFYGDLSARGGLLSGDGGTVEISSKGVLGLGGRVDAGATNGAAGTLLLDPRDITIASGGGAALTGVDQFADTSSADVTIDPDTIIAATNAGTAVTLQANNDILINNSIVSFNMSGNGGALTFQAGRNITLNAAILSDNGNVSFTVNDSNATADRQAGVGSFLNNGLIDTGAGDVAITMGTNAGGSGSISTGQVTAHNFAIVHTGPTAGAVSGQIDFGETEITNDLTISASSTRNVTNAIGTVIVRGTATIDVGAGDVTFNRATSDFNTLALTHAGTVLINDTSALRFGASNITGTLTATTKGPMAQTAAITVGGLATLTATNGGFGYGDPHIDFTSNNDFQAGVALSVASSGATGTGGYARITDANALNITTASLNQYLIANSGGALTLGTVTAGTSITGAAASGATLGTTTSGSYTTITSTAGAVDLGTVTVGTDLTVSTNGAITDSGTITAPQQTILTAGAANNITLDSANNDFHSMRIVSGNNVTLVDKSAFNFGAYNTNFGGYTSRVYGTLNVTAAGDISQTRSNEDGYSQINVDGASTFTANHASSPINLYLGSTDPFNSGESNTFTGGITLARNNGNTGFSNVQVRNTSSAAGQLAGLTSVGTLNNVYLRYDNAPSVTLPGMTLTGSLKVYAPSVVNTASVPTNIISQTGPIVVAGGTIMAAGSTGDIVMSNAGNNFSQFGIANTGARNVTLVDSNAVTLFALGYHQAVTGNYNVTAGGTISDQGNNFTISGTATFDAGANNISIINGDNYLNIVAIAAANNATINPRNSVVMSNVNVTGTLSVSSEAGGSLTQVGGTAMNVGSTTTFGLFNSGITLANTGNVFGALAISNAGAITLRENDAITQSSAWTTWGSNGGNTTRYAVSLTTSDDQAITLDQANYFGDLTITQVNSGALSAGAVYVRENADSMYGMTQGATAWTVHGTTRLDSGAYSMTLANANNLFGPLQVAGATGLTNSLPSAVTLYAKNTASADAITDVGGTGAWATGTGTVRLIAYNTAGTTAGGGNINLANTGNVMGDLYLKATNVTITENDSITDGASTSWNSAGDSGWVTTGNTSFIVANPTGKSITLDNLSNQLGAVGITTTGTAGTLSSVTITDNTDLTQSSVWTVGTAPVTLDARNHAITLNTMGNVMGNIAISTVNGTPTSVTLYEDDAITQGSNVWSLSGVPITLLAQNNKAITLTQATNVLGNLTVMGGVVGITENDAITQGSAWSTTGITTLNATSNAITLTNTGNILGDIAIGGTPSALSITEDDDITQASAWSLASTPIALNAQTHDVLLTQASNQLGNLTLTGANAVVVENHAAGITQAGAWTVSGTSTLTAGAANPITLSTASNNFGTVVVNSASTADITDTNAVIFGASTVADTLTITAGGAIAQSGALTATSLLLKGTGFATLNNVANNVANLAAGFSGGDLSYTDTNNFAIAAIGGTSGITIGANDVFLTSVNGTVTGLTNINASTTSLTLSTGTALTLPQMTIAGAQTYTASTVSGAGITLSGNISSNASGVITFNSPVTLSNDWVIQSTNSDINFLGTIVGANNQLTVNAGSGQIDLAGAISGMGATTDAAVALTLSAGGTGTTFHSTLSANNGLSVTGPVVFLDNVTLANGLVGSTFGGQVTLGKVGGMNLSGYDNFSFNGGVLLQSGAATINSNNSTMTFAGANTIHGPYDLTLNSGTQTITGLDHVGTDITSLVVTANTPTIPGAGISIAGPQTYNATSGTSITLNGPVTSSVAGAILFNSPVVLGTDATITSVDSAITFASTLDGAHDLIVNSGTGLKTFTGKVGNLSAVGDGVGASIALVGTGAATFSDTVNTRSGVVMAGPVSFLGDVTFANGNTGSTFNGLVTSGGNTLSGFDGLSFNAGLTLTGNVSVLSNGSTLSFGGSVSGPHALTLNALLGGAGTVTGLDRIATNLTGLTVTGQTLSLPTTDLAISGPMSFTAVGGITLNGNVGSSSLPSTGQIDFNGPVTLATGAIAITTNNAPINFSSTVNGARALTLNAGTNTTTFSGILGGVTPLASLTANGGVALNGTAVATSGAQIYNNAVTLGANTTLAGSALTFAGTLNGAYTFLGNISGATTFGGIVGGIAPLSSITTDSAGSVVFNTTAITTTGAQTYNELATLGANLTLTGTNLRFVNTVNGGYSLTMSASGSAQLDAAVGGSTPLTALTATGAAIVVNDVTTTGAQSYTGAVTLNGDLSTTNAHVTVTGPTTLGADVAISTNTGAGNITFTGATSTINGAHALSLAAGAGNVVLGGVIGGITPLTTVSVTGNDLTIPVVNSSSTQTYAALNDLTLSQSRTSSVPLSFTADADGNGSGSFILPTSVTLVTSNQPLTINAADIDLQGTSTINTGSGLITITPTNARNLFLGGTNAAGQMTITANELSRISTSAGISFLTTGAGWIKVAGIGATDSQNISGVLTLGAMGTGDVSFVNSASTFNALSAEAVGGTIHLEQNLTTTNDALLFVTPTAIDGTVTVASGGGQISFHDTLAVNNPLTFSTGGGALFFHDAINGTSTVTIGLAGGTVSGLNQLQSTLTGLTLSNNALVTLPTIAINGPHVYNGPVSITGDLAGVGLTFNNTAVISANNLTLNSGTGTLAFANTLGAGANNFTLTGDEINFSNTVTGTGSVVLQPSTSTLDVVVGGAGSTAGLDIVAADLAWLPSNLGGLTIGRTVGTGTLSVAAASNFGTVPLTLNGGGGISQSGTLTAGALTMRSDAGITLADTANSLGAITVLGAPTSVNIADSTDMTQGAAWVLGAAPVTLNAGSHAIALTQSANTFGALSLTGGAVQITEAADTNLGASTATSLTVVSTGAISTSGTVTVSGAASFKTLDNAGKSIALANSSTFGSVSAVSRNAADNADAAGAISLAPGGSTLLKTLSTTGNITLTAPSGFTLSQDGTSTLNAAGLELLGAGDFALTAGTNAIDTLAGNAGNVAFRENSGFAIGTVNTAGLTSSGNISLSSTGSVTQAQKLAAIGLELLGPGGAFAFNNSANTVTTLAGNTGSVSFLDDSGFAIGTVNTLGLTTTGNVTLSSTGSVTQSQKIAAAGLELLGAGSTYALTNIANAIDTLAGSVGTLSFLENSGFAVGTVNTAGLATAGNLTLSTTGAVTQSQDISTAGLELLGSGTYALTRNTNVIPVVAGNTGSADVHTSGALVIGTVNTAGFTATNDFAATAGGAVTQTQALNLGRNLSVTTTHNAGDVTVNNNGASSTQLGTSVVGGDYIVTADNGPVSQVASTTLLVVGDLTVDSPTSILDGSGNLIGGTIALPASTSSTVRASGVITLGDRTEPGDLTVVSEAANRTFDTGVIHGTAIDLNNAANSVGGAIAVTTVASVVSSGADVQTGITQSGGTSLNIAGVASFTAEASSAGSLGVVLGNDGNSFGQLRANGNIVNIKNSAARPTNIGSGTATTSFTLTTTDLITQSGAIVTPTLTISAPGAVTLNNAANDIAALVIDANGAIAYTDANSFSVTSLDAHGNAVSLMTGATGNITQTGALQNVGALTLSAGNAIALTAANTIASIAGASSDGNLQITDSTGGLAIAGPVIAASGDVTIRTTGDLTLNSGSTVEASAGDIALSTEGTGNFINNAGASTLTVGSGKRWLVYSKTPDMVGTVHTEKGGLTSAFRLYGKTFGSDNPSSILTAGNGFIYADSPSTTLTVSPTIVGAATHIYGNSPTASLGYSVSSGFIDSEDTAISIGLSGTALFDTALASSMNAGVYTIHYTGGLTSNYTLVADTNGIDYAVTKAPLTYTANVATRIYGDANPTFTGSLTGFKLSQDVSALGGAVSWTTVADTSSHVGSFAIDGSGYTSNNYSFVQAGGNATALSVTARPITVTADNQNRFYGDANASTGSFAVTGGTLVNGDALNASLGVSSPATLTSNVGSYALTPNSATFSSGASSDYTITYADGSLSITARPITLTANDQSRIYGNANPAAGTFSIGGNGLANSDALNASLSVSSAATLASHVGSYGLTPSAALFTTGSASNYAITYADGALAITARPITLTANDQNRVFGDANPTSGGFAVGGDGLANSDALGSTLTVASLATLTSDVGSYNLTPSSAVFTTGAVSDYSITYADGSLSITARPITLTADNQNRIYGEANPATGSFTVTSGNLANSDALDALVSVNSPATLISHVGSYTLTPSGVAFANGAASNYAITYADGSLAVTARPVALTANNQSRIYGDANPTTGSFTLSSGNLVNGDSLLGTLAVSSSATLASDVGNYLLMPASAVFATGSASDYAIMYTGGSLAVTQRPITVAAANQSRVYGDANPAMGNFSLTSGTLVNSDAFASSTAVVSSATLASHVGSYSLTPGSLSFTAGSSSNYAITYTDGSLAVTARPITITANNQARVYGDANPTTGSFAVGGSGLANTDALASALNVSSPATLTSNVGSYDLTPGSALFTTGAASDYAITYANGSLTVSPAMLLYNAAAASRVYGEANPVFSGSITGFRNGETFADVVIGSAVFASVADATSNAGQNAINGSGLASTGNYTFGQAAGNATALTITPRPLAVTATSVSRYYGDANPPAAPIVAIGLVNGDAVVASSVTSSATVTSSVGSYVTTPNATTFSSGLASNYAISYVNGALTVLPRPITITAADQSRIYGEANPNIGAVTTNGLVNGDTLSVAFVASSATAFSNVGSYNLTPSSVGFTAGSSSNYAIAYAAGSLSVTPRPVTVTADAQTKIYGAADPALTYQAEGQSAGRGLLTGQSLTGSLIRTAGETVAGGPYAIAQGTLAASNSNYVIAYSGSTLTITPATLTYVASPAVAYENTVAAGLSGNVTGFVGSDTLGSATTGNLLWTVAANQSSAPGQYEVTGSGLQAVDDNYVFVQAPANFTAFTVATSASSTPRPITPSFESPDFIMSNTHFSFAENTVGNGGLWLETASGGLMGAPRFGGDWVSLPSDTGMLFALTLPQNESPALGMGTFASEGTTTTLSFAGGMLAAKPVSTTLSVYFKNGDKHFPVGSFLVNDVGNAVSMNPVLDAPATDPSQTQGNASKQGTFALETAAGAPVNITVSLSDEGILTVKVPSSFAESKGVRNAALAGLAAAKTELDVTLTDIKAIVIIPE
jgi:filamentous hemagglutinin family protein